MQQLLPQRLRILIHRQLQQIHASARGRQPALIVTAIPDAEFRIQIREAQQRRPWRRRHELDQCLLILVGEVFDGFPEELDGGMFDAIVANDVEAAVLGVAVEVGYVDGGGGAGDERLQFVLIEHAEPGRSDDLAEAFEEGRGLLERLH